MINSISTHFGVPEHYELEYQSPDNKLRIRMDLTGVEFIINGVAVWIQHSDIRALATLSKRFHLE